MVEDPSVETTTFPRNGYGLFSETYKTEMNLCDNRPYQFYVYIDMKRV